MLPRYFHYIEPDDPLNGVLDLLCMPTEEDVAATEHLGRPAFGMYRVEWPGDRSVEFHLSHSDWIRLLRRSGFEVEDLIEVRPAVEVISRHPFVIFSIREKRPGRHAEQVGRTPVRSGAWIRFLS